MSNWTCARCGTPASYQGHFNIHPRCTIDPTGFHICCPEPAGCPPGGLVLDPFAGSASTLIAARAAGRRAVGIELHEPYAEAAAQRLAAGELELEATP
jgi:hypothetical protein